MLSAVLVASVLAAPPAVAQDERAEVGEEAPVLEDVEVLSLDGEPDPGDVTTVPTELRASADAVEPVFDVDPAELERQEAEARRPGWQAEIASGGVAATGRGQEIGGSPVSVQMNAADARSAPFVNVNVLESEFAAQLSPFAAAVSVGFENRAGNPVTPGRPFVLELDLSDVSLLGASDVYERLEVTAYENCELFEPDPVELSDEERSDPEFVPEEPVPLVVCDSVEELDADFDVDSRLLTVPVDLGEIERNVNARREALIESGVPAADLDGKRGREAANGLAIGHLDPDGGPGRSELAPGRQEEVNGNGNNGNNGDNGNGVARNRSGSAAAGVKTASGVSDKGGRVFVPLSRFPGGLDGVSLQTGNTGGGVTYGVTTSASSSSGDYSAFPVPTLTDSQVGLFSGSAEISYPIPSPEAAGPQPAVGFAYSSASIDGMTMGTNNQTGPLGTGWALYGGGSIQRALAPCNDPAAPGDRCISSAPDDVYTLNLGGQSSNLVYDGTQAGVKRFRLESDPFWRISLHTGATPMDEYWTVETPDGTVYELGSELQSQDWLPVWYPSGTNPCGDPYRLCDTVRQWNVDTVTDAFGNQMTYQWGQEMNWYRARGISSTYRREYVRASQLESIEYGAHPGLNRRASARIVINYEWRCLNSSSFSSCGEYAAGFNDVPEDLWCGAHAEADEYDASCTEPSPTFWTHLRVSGVLSQVAAAPTGDRWVTVANHDPAQGWARDTSASFLDSSNQQVLNHIAERPIDANGSAAGGTYERYGFDVLYAADRDSHSGATGIDSATDDIGVDAVVTSMGNGEWIKFEDVWLGEPGGGVNSAIVRMSAIRQGTIEIRLGSPTGTLIAQQAFNSSNFTNGLRDFESFELNVATERTGVHDVYVRMSRPNNVQTGYLSWIRFGTNAYGDLPEVGTTVFNNGGFDFRDNRVNHPTGVSAMRFPRIKRFINQLGGITDYVYGQDNPCPAGKSSGWDTNSDDCFPQWDTSTSQPGFVVFNKWVVQSMTRSDSFSGQPAVPTTYDYEQTGWGYFDNPDSTSDTWNNFRGYNIVTVTNADGDQTEYRFHQGLDGERSAGGGTQNVTVSRSNGATIDDSYALRGQIYETRQLTSGNTEISRVWTWYENAPTTAGTDRDDPRFVAPSRVDVRTDGTAETRTLYQYNAWGQPTSVNEQGDTSDTADNRTTVTRYYNANTSTTLGAWRSPFACVTALRQGNSTAAPATNSAAGFVRWSQTFYDNHTAANCSVSVNKPVVRRVSAATSNTGRVTTTYGVNTRGLVTVTQPPRGDASSTTTTYDLVFSQPVQTRIDHQGWTSTVTYDEWRRPITTKDINGLETTSSYDEYSRVVAVRNEVSDDQNRDTVQYTYNQDARPAYVTTATHLDGAAYARSTSFVDGFGRNILNRERSYHSSFDTAYATRYDNVGRAYRTSGAYAISGSAVATFEYPDWTRVPSFTEVQFDEASRPVTTLTRSGVNGTVSNLLQSSVQYNGFTTTTTDPNGYWTDTTIDGLGRTLEVKEQQFNADTDYTYNAADDLLTVTAPDNQVTTLTYDRLGRKLTSDEPDSGVWSYAYDANSNLTRQTDPSNTVTTFTFDDLDRPRLERIDNVTRIDTRYDGDPDALGASHIEFHIDATEGNVVRRSYYDEFARLDRQRSDIPNAANTVNRIFETEYTLRADGQPSSISYPSDSGGGSNYTIDYGYSTLNGAAVSLQEDAGSGGETIVHYTYWTGEGNLKWVLYGPGGADGYRGFLHELGTNRLTHARGGPNTNVNAWQYLRYTYDNNGNIASIYDHWNSGQLQCFTYDGLDRLRTAFTDSSAGGNCNTYTPTGAGNYNETYTYNVGGNITSKTGNGDYFYDDADHVHAVTRTSDGSTFAYDANGDQTLRNLAGQPAQTLTWTEDRQLASIGDSNQTTEFRYDSTEARVRRDIDGDSTYYPGGGVEWDEATGTFTYYHMHQGMNVGYTTSDGDTTWVFSDQIASTSLTRTDTGVNNVQRYTPFGEVRTDGNLDTDHTYTGQIFDQGTGLGFYNARYYDPVTGRFISPDTMVPNAADGQDFNRYGYVRNNPISANDPTGHCTHFIHYEHGGFECDFYVGSEAGRPIKAGAPEGAYTYDLPERELPLWAEFTPLGTIKDTLDCLGGPGWSCLGAPLPGPNLNRLGDVADIASDARRVDGAPRTTPNGLAVRLCRSFSADTEVVMADGTTKPISEVEVGDVVWALDPETGVEGERTVTGVWPHYDWLLNFAVGKGFVQTTEDHHFWNESDREWQETAHIDTGDLLLTADGSFVAAGDLDWTSRTYGEAFDLTVEGLHTYFVDFGEGSVLVHNTDCSFDELGGLAAYVDRADLIGGVVEHAAARGRTILPSQVDDALSTTGTRIRDGIPGRDNAVRFELDDLVVIINEDTPWESTAFFR